MSLGGHLNSILIEGIITEKDIIGYGTMTCFRIKNADGVDIWVRADSLVAGGKLKQEDIKIGRLARVHGKLGMIHCSSGFYIDANRAVEFGPDKEEEDGKQEPIS